ncbi:hypothetical protein PIB30_093295 [Stylosanthes scabra]|uniref:Uncharacterized protein n=1 Tax=Stylosanthes scabra TaxID=79078 RepID=A0ABU6SW09_9FABA|nr:hypothetical protein [Stylosanthes scabra]
MKENHKRFESQLSHITELLHKFTNQPITNPQPQPFTSSPLPSQPLPNPKGGINMVHNETDEEEEEEDDEEWLYELLAELADSDDSDDEEVEEEPEREVDDEVVEEETKGETFFIATIFRGNEVKATEMPCLVASKIRGWISPNACVIRELVVMSCLPHFMKLCILITEIFHVTRPPAPRKKGAHQLRVGSRKIEPEKLLGSEKRKESENSKNDAFIEKGLRIAPPQLKKKRKKVPLNLEKKKEKKKKKASQRRRRFCNVQALTSFWEN